MYAHTKSHRNTRNVQFCRCINCREADWNLLVKMSQMVGGHHFFIHFYFPCPANLLAANMTNFLFLLFVSSKIFTAFFFLHTISSFRQKILVSLTEFSNSLILIFDSYKYTNVRIPVEFIVFTYVLRKCRNLFLLSLLMGPIGVGVNRSRRWKNWIQNQPGKGTAAAYEIFVMLLQP